MKPDLLLSSHFLAIGGLGEGLDWKCGMGKTYLLGNEKFPDHIAPEFLDVKK